MENVLSQDQPNEKSYILQKEILSLREACIYLCISQSHMYKLTSSRKIPHYSPLITILRVAGFRFRLHSSHLLTYKAGQHGNDFSPR